MKIISIFAVMILSGISAFIVSPIWATIEFLTYLFKDTEFNMWSVWSCVISFVVWLVSYVAFHFLKDPIVQYNLRHRGDKKKEAKSKWERAKEMGESLNSKK